jgi:crotonobetainyl-CoA:carnitine CoA-transferase CaiB-like acyl-CoA transferase
MTVGPNDTSATEAAADLTGIRVVEIGELVSAPYATKLLADFGADVIKVEPPGGDEARRRGPFRRDPDPDASGLFLALNTGKSSIVVEPVDPGTADQGPAEPLQALLDLADIVITNRRPSELRTLGVDLDQLMIQRPDLVICSVTPYGLSGPRANWEAEELTVAHGGGWAYQCPGTSADPELPPLKVFGHQTDFHGGLAAAMASLAALDRAERTGIGELIDLSTTANTVGMLEAAFIAASYLDLDPSRLGSRLLNPWGIFPCADGLIFLVTVEQDQWERLVGLMGNPDWAETGLFDTIELRLENEDLLTIYLEEWTRAHTVEELWHKGQAERICFAPVLTMADMANQVHLNARGFFVDVDHPTAGTITHLGPPFRSTGLTWGPARPAPRLDPAARPEFGPGRPARPIASTGEVRPLDGIRVLDLSWVWAGPYATMHLAFLGAEVIKIESSSRPGLGRRLALHPPDVEPSLNTSAYFNQWEQGKLSCELDLSRPEAVEIVKQLVAHCDVVVENFATGVMDRLGLDYETLREINPGVIVASVSGYGSDGPLADYMGYGPTTGPLSGLTSLTGYVEGQPEELGVSFGDPASGMMAAFAVCAALVARNGTGSGSYLDIALWEATASNAVEGWMAHALGVDPPPRAGNRDVLMAPHGCFRTAAEPGDSQREPVDPGRWVAIACRTDEQWRALARCIDSPAANDERFATAAGRKANEEELDTIITEWTHVQDRWVIAERLQAVGVAAHPSMSPKDLLADEHLRARGYIEELDHPEVGKRAHTGIPWRLSNSPHGVLRAAPTVGQHTDNVLGQLLGLSEAMIDDLRQRGISA